MTVFCAMLIGCHAPDKLVYDNYNRIQPCLSTEGDVTQLLGEPNHVLGERWMYERPEQHLHVFVDFGEDGRVERKQWIDAAADTWEDSDDSPGNQPAHERTDVNTRKP
jgi:hypothetical protein